MWFKEIWNIQGKKQPHTHIGSSWWNQKGNILINRGVQVRIEHRRLYLLWVMHVFSIFRPHIRHVRGVGIGLTLQEGILGYIDGEASRRDDNDGRTWREEELKAFHVCIPRSRNIKTLICLPLKCQRVICSCVTPPPPGKAFRRPKKKRD